MVRVGIVIVTGDFAIPLPSVHSLCLDEYAVRVEPQRLDPGGARKRFQLVQDPARDALPARFSPRPHPLDLAHAPVDAPQPAAADRSAVDPSENEKAVGRRHLLLRRQVALARIKAALETCPEFAEICGEAPPRCRAV